MKKFLEKLKPFKMPLIILGIFGAVFLIFGKVLPAINNISAMKSPIKKIVAENKKIYTQDMNIASADFDVVAIHENGKKSTVDSDSIELDKKKPDVIGKKTNVTISLKDHPNIKVICKVKNERKKLEEYFCGHPNIKDAKVVLYSNGELQFQGNGNILEYDRGDAPWQNTENQVKSVTFEKTITPESMDYWFEGFRSLVFVDTMPSTVTSAVAMLKDCSAIEEGVDWSACTELLDISHLYENCENIRKIPKIPSTVKNGTALCRNCKNLQTAPDMSDAKSMKNADSMYEGCLILTETNSAPALKQANQMYARCINLRKAPVINEGILFMSDMFKDNASLVTASRIPKSAKTIDGCYSDCPKLKGDLIIDTSTDDYERIFRGSVNATTLNLTGKSTKLNEMALTNDLGNIYVRGKTPYVEEN